MTDIELRGGLVLFPPMSTVVELHSDLRPLGSDFWEWNGLAGQFGSFELSAASMSELP